MKNIKKKDIDPEKLITKAEYARMIGKSQTTVQTMIRRGELTIVIAKGAELIHL